jgi:hypothetical protein
MTTVIISADCGNSPKNKLLEKLTIAFAEGDAEFIRANVTDDIRWNIIGEKVIQGKADFAAALAQAKEQPVLQLTIQHVVSHGKAGAVNGVAIFEDGKRRAFCDVYEFSGASGRRVREITSYRVEIV